VSAGKEWAGVAGDQTRPRVEPGSLVSFTGWGAAWAGLLGSPREACVDRMIQPVSFARSDVDALLSMPADPLDCDSARFDCDSRIDRSPCCCRSTRLHLRCSPSDQAPSDPTALIQQKVGKRE
jgi:hypothetical protein